MKLGSFTISRQKRVKLSVAQEVTAFINSPEMTAIAAKMARSEVKNYMAEVAEAAGVPYEGPVKFMEKLNG